MDNVLVAYVCFRTIKNKREGKEGLCAVKQNMHTTYDCVEWSFLGEIVLKLGFRENWVCNVYPLLNTGPDSM